MTFTYWGNTLDYYDHPYNDTAKNERQIEVAVALAWLPPKSRTGMLEVGAVLGHYGVTGQRVVDLHEQGEGIDNIDLFTIAGRYRRIVSISTVEHTADPTFAIEYLRSLLISGGKMLLTAPGGNARLDHYLAGGAGTRRCCTFVRDGDGDGWTQTDELTFLPYASVPPGWAASVWIGEFG